MHIKKISFHKDLIGILAIICMFCLQEIKAADTTLIDVITLPYNIRTIASDSAGTIWSSGARGLQYYDFEKKSFVTIDPSYKSEILAEDGKIIRFVQIPRDFPWPEFSGWLSHIPPGYDRVSAGRDKFGHYWVSTGPRLFIFSVEDRFEQILSGYSTRGIYRDGGDLYVNSYLRGILKNGQSLIEKPIFAEGEINKFRESLYFAWGGLIRYEPGTQTAYYVKFNKSHGALRNPRPIVAHNLDPIRDTIWVGTNYGLGFVVNDSVLMVSNYPNIQDVVNFKDGLLIAGSNFVISVSLKQPIPRHNLPEPACEDCRGMYVWQNDQLRKLDVPELNYRQILEAEGNYYFASDSGVVVWDGAKVTAMITESDGLTDNRTCTMAMDEDGFLWVSTFSGLNRINPSTGKITRYLENIEFNYRSVHQKDSLIYMGGMQGIYVFNPKEFIGDDIEAVPPWNFKQLLVLLGVGMPLFFSIIVIVLHRYHIRKIQLREVQLQETEKKLFLLQIDQVIFSTDVPITVSNLAHALDMSERTLYRNFREYELTPGAYLKELKLKKARHLLNDTSDQFTMREVAQKVGYTEQYLSRLLKSND